MTNMPKPEGSFWSDDQWSAISESGEDILVAAAAGSGKTAVLVERIIRKIADPSQGFSVDRLLVATFTKAAAAEMKQRIREALERALEEQPGEEHLRKQVVAAWTGIYYNVAFILYGSHSPLLSANSVEPGFSYPE